MKQRYFQDLLQTSRNLVGQKGYQEAARLLLSAKLSLDSRSEWEQVLVLINDFPKPLFVQDAHIALLKARALRCLNNRQELIDWLSSIHSLNQFALVWLECTAALNGLGRYAEARDLLQEIIPNLTGEDLGIAWARHAFARFNLKAPWEESYKRALPLLEGEELGRALLNYGYCLSMERRYDDASEVWFKALTCFKRNPHFSVWIRCNLATVGLNSIDPQVERHLLMALREVQNPKARGQEPDVWNNLGQFRCVLGEWNRAEFAFEMALQTTKVQHAKQMAYRGIARVQLLSGRLAEALETLEAALQEPDIQYLLLLCVIQAKVYLKLNRPAKAKAALEKAGPPQFELEEWPWRITMAELARQEGRLEEAVELLEGLPLQSLEAREDVGLFPLLFQLLQAANKPVPEPLPYIQGITVAVQAVGVLQVSVNGRPIDLLPAGRVGELLVFLLEQGGQASLETIGDALYPDFTEPKKRRQSIWKLVDKLREALGWQDSVRALGGAYQLDLKATWDYDIARVRQTKAFEGEFLAGVYSDWALETGQELRDMEVPERRLNLN